METIINSSEINDNFIEKIKELYFNKQVRITIEEVKSFDKMTGKEQLKHIRKLRERHPPFHVPDDVDISEIAKQVNA